MVEFKVVLVQFDPFFRDPGRTRRKVEKLVNKAAQTETNISLIILPETAFSGYNFLSEDDILPVAKACEKETILFSKEMSQKYNCGVVAGYTRVDKAENKLYNSQLVVNPEGEIICTYDKSHLYYNDKTWATEGNGFKSIELDWILKEDGSTVKAALGICMDINPKEFLAPFDEFELGTFCEEENVDMLLFSSAWTTSEEITDDLSTINYWLKRLTPVLKAKKRFFFVCANRIGQEENSRWDPTLPGFTRFVGNSCVLDFEKKTILDRLKPGIEAARIVSFQI